MWRRREGGLETKLPFAWRDAAEEEPVAEALTGTWQKQQSSCPLTLLLLLLHCEVTLEPSQIGIAAKTAVDLFIFIQQNIFPPLTFDFDEPSLLFKCGI